MTTATMTAACIAEVRDYLSRAGVEPSDVEDAVSLIRAGFTLEGWGPNPRVAPFVALILGRHAAPELAPPDPDDAGEALDLFEAAGTPADAWDAPWVDEPLESLDLDAFDEAGNPARRDDWDEAADLIIGDLNALRKPVPASHAAIRGRYTDEDQARVGAV